MKLIIISWLWLTGTAVYGQLYQLHGTWTVDVDATLAGMSHQQRTTYDSLPDYAKGNLRNSFHGRKFRFLENNSVEITYFVRGTERRVQGTWAYSEQTGELSVTAKGETRRFDAKWEQPGRLMLKFRDNAPKAILKSMCLVRN